MKAFRIIRQEKTDDVKPPLTIEVVKPLPKNKIKPTFFKVKKTKT